MNLKKVNVVGNIYQHFFIMKNGEIKKIECTQEQYRFLEMPNAKNPTVKNGIWDRSYVNYRYDTVSGDLEDGTYAESGDVYAVKIAGKQKDVRKNSIVNDMLDPSVKIDSVHL